LKDHLKNITEENFNDKSEIVDYNTWYDDRHVSAQIFTPNTKHVAHGDYFSINLQGYTPLCQTWVYLLPCYAAYNNITIMDAIKSLYDMHYNKDAIHIKKENKEEWKIQYGQKWETLSNNFIMILLDYLMKRICKQPIDYKNDFSILKTSSFQEITDLTDDVIEVVDPYENHSEDLEDTDYGQFIPVVYESGTILRLYLSKPPNARTVYLTLNDVTLSMKAVGPDGCSFRTRNEHAPIQYIRIEFYKKEIEITFKHEGRKTYTFQFLDTTDLNSVILKKLLYNQVYDRHVDIIVYKKQTLSELQDLFGSDSDDDSDDVDDMKRKMKRLREENERLKEENKRLRQNRSSSIVDPN